MITVAEIRKKSENLYYEYLKNIVSGEPFFPRTIRSDKSVSNDFGEMRNELAEVIKYSNDRKNYGYLITYKQVNTRKHGTQSLPEEISFQNELDYLRFINKEQEAEYYKNSITIILSRFSELTEWVKQHPKKIIDNISHWESLLNVCNYFKKNPNPNLYIRELPIKVHTKFIENNKGILFELLNVVLPPNHINREFTTAKEFEKRFGLKYNQSRIRVRVLDSQLTKKYLSGLTDIEITEDEFSSLNIPCKKVFILENKTNFSNLMNFLTLPQIENTIAIFGSGFKVGNLKKALWLKEKEVFYWGDIDTHGLQILSQIRGYFPLLRSIMMDFETLNSFKSDWGHGEPITVSNLQNLNHEEQELFAFVKENNIRLEQEKN